jgi:hypothetical protein
LSSPCASPILTYKGIALGALEELLCSTWYLQTKHCLLWNALKIVNAKGKQ